MASNTPAQSNPPGLPQPGPAPQDAAAPLPFLTFNPGPSPCQNPTVIAVGGNPGDAGPRATVPTTPMQDFGQPMGRTLVPAPPSTAAGGSP